MKLRILSVVGLFALVLVGCAPNIETVAEDHELITALDVVGLDAQQAINQLDATALADRSPQVIASVRSDRLVVTNPDQSQYTELLFDNDEFYLSIAPFINVTHECYFHSLTTCVGELQNKTVNVTVTNVATGVVVLSEERTTFDNGFLGLWLPRNSELTIEISYEGQIAVSVVHTAADSPTCITTMQLR